MTNRRGYSLVELAIVVAVMGVILAAVYLFFFQHSDVARTVTDSNQTALDSRLAMDEIEGFLRNAGLVTTSPPGEWHPVQAASPTGITYVADIERPQMIGPEDTLTLARDDHDRLVVTDAAGNRVYQGVISADMTLSYLDGDGDRLEPDELATQAGRDRIRQISASIDMGEVGMASSSRTVTPPNLAYAGGTLGFEVGSPAMAGGTDDENFLLEDFEAWPPTFAWEDSIEMGIGWVPIIAEDFETAASWANNWVFYSEDNGRIQRNGSIVPHAGTYSMRMDASPTGTYSLNAGIWKTDLSSYDMNVDELRLHFYWKGYDEAHPEDGVFFPEYTAESVTLLDSEDFSGFRFSDRGDWTYWNTSYGNIVVTDVWPYDGNYINMDSRVMGQDAQNRIMWENDLSAYSTSENLEFRYYFSDRGDQNDDTENGDFIGLAGTEGISGTITPVEYLYPESYPDGSWSGRTVDLDASVPAGYDWSQFRIVIGQAGDQKTQTQTGTGGISIDNVAVWENVEADTAFNDQLLGGDPGSAWEEASIDLDQMARDFGNPFSADYHIAFCQYDNYAWSSDGIAWDDISIDVSDTTILGWTHGAYTGNDQWVASEHTSTHGSACWSVNAADDYDPGTHHVWLQTPDIDLTGYAGADRVSFSFRQQYDWAGDGDGAHVLIWNETTSAWDLLIPYWGYYTASVPGLAGQAGWDGTSSGWNYCVMDITPYAGQTTRVRFEYGLMAPSTADGWDIDYCRVKIGVDWPQVIFYGWPLQQYADWFAYQSLPGGGDPVTAGEGLLAAGNDMASGGIWDTYYEDFTHNALVSPPVTFDNSGGSFYYIEFLNCLRTELGYDTGFLEMAAFGQTIGDTTFVEIGAWGGSSTDWWTTRIYLAPYLAMVGSDTVIFRWRMQADGSSSNYGGWNIDSIACFSSSTPLPELIVPLGGDYARGEGIVYIPPEELTNLPPVHGQGFSPVVMPEVEDRRTHAPLR